MKSRKFLVAFAIAFSAVGTFAQGSGKVNLRADIETMNENRDMQVSVIDLASKDLLQREEVSNHFFYSLPLDGRFMIHFQKEGHPTARLIVDTNVPDEQGYNIHFAINLKDPQSAMETGISIAAGTLNYNAVTKGFVLTAPESGKADLAAITYTGLASEVVKF